MCVFLCVVWKCYYKRNIAVGKLTLCTYLSCGYFFLILLQYAMLYVYLCMYNVNIYILLYYSRVGQLVRNYVPLLLYNYFNSLASGNNYNVVRGGQLIHTAYSHTRVFHSNLIFYPMRCRTCMRKYTYTIHVLYI